MNFKDIHIGILINQRVTENGIEISRICNFLNTSEEEVLKMYEAKSLDSDILLRWSKLLNYDFFRIYSQHLILYSPVSANPNKKKNKKSDLPTFRKNIYTQEIINFILENLNSGKKTKTEIIKEYNIPRTTLYKWISKNKK
jgi:transcriptional regulator with PAS, ATPase and Fis domain